MHEIRSSETIQKYVSMFDMKHFLNENLLRNLRLFDFPPYTNIYIEQEKQNYLYLLVDGQVQCNHYHMNGKLAVIGIFDPLFAIGDLEIMSDRYINSNVITISSVLMLGLEKRIIEQYGKSDPAFLLFLIEQLRDKLYRNNQIQKNNGLSAISRLSLYLLSHTEAEDSKAVLFPDKESLSSLLGITERHLNRVKKDLVLAGAIDDGYPTVRVLDKSVLESFLEN